MESIRERPRGTHRRHSGDGLRYHPKTEPYKLMLNPPECIRMENWEAGFFYTYNGYAKVPKDNFEPMYVASEIKFHPADAALLLHLIRQIVHMSLPVSFLHPGDGTLHGFAASDISAKPRAKPIIY